MDRRDRLLEPPWRSVPPLRRCATDNAQSRHSFGVPCPLSRQAAARKLLKFCWQTDFASLVLDDRLDMAKSLGNF